MRTEKIKLLSTLFLCVLENAYFAVRYNTLIISLLRFANAENSSTFVLANYEGSLKGWQKNGSLPKRGSPSGSTVRRAKNPLSFSNGSHTERGSRRVL